MSFFRKLFGNMATRIWAIVTVSTIVVLLVVTILATTLFYETIKSFLGTEIPVITGERGTDYYKSDFESKAAAVENGNALTIEQCREGFVLLKNEKNVLPIQTSASSKKRVSVFGKSSVNLVYGGSGSGGFSKDGIKTLYDSLTAANFEYNPALKNFYDSAASGSGRQEELSIEDAMPSGLKIGETPYVSYSDEIKGTFSQYSDMALVVFSRIGGEGNDMPMSMAESWNKRNTPIAGAASADDHYLEINQDEQDMLQMVCENFEKVIVLINSNNVMELDFLENSDARSLDSSLNNYDYASKIDGAIWIGGPGRVGIMALGEILNGSVTPSGKTVDTYAADFTKDPTWNNFSWGGERYRDSYYVGSNMSYSEFYSDYEEGIYVGYKYYETADFESKRNNYTGFDYNKAVVYPFGHGLSYTKFDWSVKNSTPLATPLEKDSTVSITIEVENTGDYDGKEVVQAYVTAPYDYSTQKAIEKPYVSLIGFEKTGLIKANTTDNTAEVTITFAAEDLASYDYNDANDNGFSGYELEAGNYEVKLCRDAHTVVETLTYSVAKDIRYEKDSVSNTEVKNRFGDADDQLGTVLSRRSFTDTWPQKRSLQEKTVDQSFVNELMTFESHNPLTADSDIVKNSDLTVATKKATSPIQLFHFIDENNHVDFEDKRWDTILSCITMSTMVDLCHTAVFKTNDIVYIGKPLTYESDGPVGWVNFMNEFFKNTCAYASECILASTWNKEILYQMGENIGNEGIFGNGNMAPYSGWYAPGVNIHRSPFGGRNYEYFSEDPFLTGVMGANQVKGAMSKGVYCYVKHFAVNESETNRNGICTWLDEQSLREVYLKPFKMIVQEGGATAMMSSFNRIGKTWTGGDYRLLTEVLREEWGFRGTVLSDFATGKYMNSKQMIYAGGDILLNNVSYENWVNAKDTMDVYVMKLATKNVLYTVAGSNAMNGFGDGMTYSTILPAWTIILLSVDGTVVISFAVWGFIVIRKMLKKKESID